ncbi:hypothetical protein DAPPUDRAFT_262680 [Daphnia pulex]|uniref:Uncharacterized protein n=1 Tax=Daphnia pulex TaxID=6669 RepID=E9HNG8_DAPPU|nr:hypothetical protein DAPPUDRAFT_262680 [Daphnia pulex]|eukprot:EFX66714.1 hypothetical protein DAPPUDRAFT_262680 [Daphnia pulex]
METSFKNKITLGADSLMVKASAPTLSDLVARVADTGSELTVTALGETPNARYVFTLQSYFEK